MPKDHSYIFFHSGMYREAVIFRITGNGSCSIIGKPAGIPRTDPGYPYPSYVPGVHIFSGYPFFSTDAASVSFFPISFLLFPDILKHDHIRMVFFCISCDCSCDLSSEFCVKALRISPPAFSPVQSHVPLESAYPSQHTVHPVFFHWENQ